MSERSMLPKVVIGMPMGDSGRAERGQKPTMIFQDLMNGSPSSSEVRSSRQRPRAPGIQQPLRADLIARSFSEPVPLHIHQSFKPVLTSYNEAKLNVCRSSPTSLKVQRRKYRYEKAEGSLAYSLWLCQREPSPHALRLRALEEVATRLTAHADDAKASATRLRIALADREADPAIYSALQRSRWMEEHRQEATEKEIICIRNHLSSLSESLEQESISTKTSTVQRRPEFLLRFFETTRRELPIGLHSKTSKKGPSLKAPLPLLLPQKLNMIAQADSAGSESESDALDSLMTPCSPVFSLPTATPIIPSKQMSISPAGDGVVTIFQSQPHAQASLVPSDIVVAIPDYAWDLINNFSPNGDGELTEISSTLSTHAAAPSFVAIQKYDTVTSPLRSAQSTADRPLLPPKPASRRPSSMLFSLPEAASSRFGNLEPKKPATISTAALLANGGFPSPNRQSISADERMISRLKRRLSNLRKH